MKEIKLLLIALPILLISCASIERIQTPKPPFDYIVKKVTIENRSANITLDGILTLPDEQGNYPVVILASGSGPNNYNQEYYGHNTFWVLADYLTKNGISVLRVNDRDYDKSPIEFYQNTTADFATDIASAVFFLQGNDSTKDAPIGLLGHSEGGIVCSMVAAENEDISFLILLGTPGLPMEEGNILAAKLSYELAGVPEDETAHLMTFHEAYNQIVINYQDDSSAKAQVETLYDSYFRGTEAYNKNDRYNLVTKVTLPWYRYMNQNDPRWYLTKIKVPLLAIIGEYDSQIVPDENLQAISESFHIAGNVNIRIIKMDDLNHMLQPTNSYRNYLEIDETISENLMFEVKNWVYSLDLVE